MKSFGSSDSDPLQPTNHEIKLNLARFKSTNKSRNSRSIVSILEEIVAFCESADERNFQDFQAAFTLTMVVEAITLVPRYDISRECNSSPATFERWKSQLASCKDGTEFLPHPALVGGLFEGLKEMANKLLEVHSRKDEVNIQFEYMSIIELKIAALI